MYEPTDFTEVMMKRSFEEEHKGFVIVLVPSLVGTGFTAWFKEWPGIIAQGHGKDETFRILMGAYDQLEADGRLDEFKDYKNEFKA